MARRVDGANVEDRRPAARHPADHRLDRGRRHPCASTVGCALAATSSGATDFREETRTTEHGGGGKGGGGGGGTEVTEYFYFASLAVALCEGPITGIGRVWADGKLMSLEGVAMRVHLGGDDQAADPFIATKMGAAHTPAYRGTADVVFEELPLERFGNRLPQLSFEVFRPILDGEFAESLVRAVTLIPASGEFANATEGGAQRGGRY